MSNKEEKSEGLGDTVEKFLKKSGIGKVAKAFLGEDCGCAKRKEDLNTMFDYNKKARCMTKEQAEAFIGFLDRDPKQLNKEDQKLIINLYNTIFKTNVAGCSGCNGNVWKGYIRRVQSVFDNYINNLKVEKDGEKSGGNSKKTGTGKSPGRPKGKGIRKARRKGESSTNGNKGAAESGSASDDQQQTLHGNGSEGGKVSGDGEETQSETTVK